MGHRQNTNIPAAKSRIGSLSWRDPSCSAPGWTVAAAALPNAVFAADNIAISPVMTKLSTYMSEAAAHALPDEVVEKAKHHILDTFAAMISGSDSASGSRRVFQYARDFTGRQDLPRSPPSKNDLRVHRKQHSLMACSPNPMKRTTPMNSHNPIHEDYLQPRWQRAKKFGIVTERDSRAPQTFGYRYWSANDDQFWRARV